MIENAKVKQGTPEWFEARRGKITGTGFAKVLSKRGNTRKDYMRQLILERKTGITTESFSNDAMEWGTKTEPQARKYYEKVSGYAVVEVGFFPYLPLAEADRVEFGQYVGVSPDGLVSKNGIVEIKCPNTNTHLEYIAKGFPSKYKAQVQGILWVTGRKWCDFISFDPRVEKEPYCCFNIQRDEPYINNLKDEVSKFIDEMVKMQAEFKDVDPQLLMDVSGGSSEDEWLQMKQMEIRGKVRHGVVCALIQASGLREGVPKVCDGFKKDINEWVDFIVTGS
jgi:putative phage-type endonuclease